MILLGCLIGSVLTLWALVIFAPSYWKRLTCNVADAQWTSKTTIINGRIATPEEEAKINEAFAKSNEAFDKADEAFRAADEAFKKIRSL